MSSENGSSGLRGVSSALKIALLNQFFHPDSAATSQILTDVARDLSHSCTITAICGANGYADPDSEMPPPVTIIRTRNLGFGRSWTARISSYVSFLAGVLQHGFRISKPDIILTLTTPPLLSVIGAVLQAARGSHHYIWEMDLYPDTAVALRFLQHTSLLARVARVLANWSRNRADGIIALGEEMKQRLVDQGIPATKISICENWADGREITPLAFPEGPLCIHYSGNLGLAHDIDTICDTMLAVRTNPHFQFAFCGAGPARAGLEAFCVQHDIRNVTFQPYSARLELGRSLAEGHVGLVTQKPETLGCLVPSKTYGIMAAGRPILFIGPREATPARIIEQFHCGWHIEPGDVTGLVQLLEMLDRRRDLVVEAGSRARKTFEQNYDRSIGVGRIAAVLGVERRNAAESSMTPAQPVVSASR